MQKLDKVCGCLLGGAAGDALGYPVKEMSEQQIFQRYGHAGITQYEVQDGIAEISDATQMTLFTANGVLCAAATGGFEKMIPCIAESYEDWYRTQNEPFPAEGGHSWLLTIKTLYSRRASETQCMDALRNGANGTIEHPTNQSKGCGGLVRVAPIGLYFAGYSTSTEEADLLGARAAALTHGHELGYIPAAALVHIVRMLVEDKEATVRAAVLDSMDAMQGLFPQAKYFGVFMDLMQKAVTLAESDKSDLDAIHALGEGWSADEALVIAVFCATRYADDFEKAIIAAVNHNGNSASTGAVTGSILGAYSGEKSIPKKFRYNLELSGCISEIADDICKIQRYTSFWTSKYRYQSYRIRNGFISTSSYARDLLDPETVTRIVIPEGIKKMDHGIFRRCIHLTSIVVPSSLTELPVLPPNVAELIVDAQNPYMKCVNGIVYNKAMTELWCCLPTLSLTRIVVPEGVTYIDGDAFSGGDRLEEIVLPDSLEAIGNGAFEGCCSLKVLRIPAKCEFLGEDALVGCDSLEEIIIDDNCDLRPDMIEDAFGVPCPYSDEELLRFKIRFRGKAYNYQTYEEAYYRDKSLWP